MRSAVFLGGLAACALATLALAPHWGAVPIDGWAEAQRWLGPSEAWTGDTKIFAMRVARALPLAAALLFDAFPNFTSLKGYCLLLLLELFQVGLVQN